MIVEDKTWLELRNNIVDLSIICENGARALALHHALRASLAHSVTKPKRLGIEFINVQVEWDTVFK